MMDDKNVYAAVIIQQAFDADWRGNSQRNFGQYSIVQDVLAISVEDALKTYFEFGGNF